VRHTLVLQALNDQLGGRATRFAHTSEPNPGSTTSDRDGHPANRHPVDTMTLGPWSVHRMTRIADAEFGESLLTASFIGPISGYFL
jgi:hypothetical protein